MIQIFNGTRRGTAGSPPGTTFVQFTHDIIPYMASFGASDWTVFCCLALHMDSDGYCFPGILSISKITGLSSPTVRRALDRLCELEIEGRPVLAKKHRFEKSGRQTSNGYVLFPGSGEGVKNDSGEAIKNSMGEGVKIDTPITLNKNHIQPEPKRTYRSKRVPTMPEPTDTGRILYEAYRSVVYPEMDPTEFTLGEWMSIRHVVYQMVHKGIEPDHLRQATQTLILKWGGRRDMVTMNALWKHWSAATTGATVTDRRTDSKPTANSVTESAIDVFRKVTGES
jgi:Helix-turn-helix domain